MNLHHKLVMVRVKVFAQHHVTMVVKMDAKVVKTVAKMAAQQLVAVAAAKDVREHACKHVNLTA